VFLLYKIGGCDCGCGTMDGASVGVCSRSCGECTAALGYSAACAAAMRCWCGLTFGDALRRLPPATSSVFAAFSATTATAVSTIAAV